MPNAHQKFINNYSFFIFSFVAVTYIFCYRKKSRRQKYGKAMPFVEKDIEKDITLYNSYFEISVGFLQNL
jgi:hypothetical protein